MLMKEYCFIDDYIISNYICFMFQKQLAKPFGSLTVIHMEILIRALSDTCQTSNNIISIEFTLMFAM